MEKCHCYLHEINYNVNYTRKRIARSIITRQHTSHRSVENIINDPANTQQSRNSILFPHEKFHRARSHRRSSRLEIARKKKFNYHLYRATLPDFNAEN